MGEVSYKVLSNEVWNNGAHDLVQHWHAVLQAAQNWRSAEYALSRTSLTRIENAYMKAQSSMPQDIDDCTEQELEDIKEYREALDYAQKWANRVASHDNAISAIIIEAVEAAKLKAYQEFASTNPDFVVIENWDEQDYFSSDIPEDDTAE